VLRPQFLWKWSLPEGVTWSFYVAIATIAGTIMYGPEILGVVRHKPSPGSEEDGPAQGRWLTTAHIFVYFFAVWVVLSYLTARVRSEMATLFLIDYAKYFLMFFISAIVLRTVRQVWILFILTGLAIGYVAYEINFLYFVNGYLGIVHNGYGGMDNNGAGLYLAMGVPLCFFAWEVQRRWFRWAFLALIPLLMHAVMMTYSRGAMLSLLLASPLLLLRSRRRKQVGLVFLGLVLLVPFLAGREIRDRFFTMTEYEREASAKSRLGSWTAAWNMAKDNPVFGLGLRNSNIYSIEYGTDKENRTIHNQYLQLAADCGFVGLGLYLAILVAVWRGVRRVRRATRVRYDPEGSMAFGLANGIECSLAVFCIGAMFLSCEAFELQYLLLLLGAQLPLVVGAPPEGTPQAEKAAPALVLPRKGPIANLGALA
jgi:probable O-glycosylation ligase (exosortase A-associated)